MQQSPSWETNSRSASQEISYFLWNSKDSLPCSQQPTIGSYPKPDESRPLPYTFFTIHLILSSQLRYLARVSFLRFFQMQFCMHLVYCSVSKCLSTERNIINHKLIAQQISNHVSKPAAATSSSASNGRSVLREDTDFYSFNCLCIYFCSIFNDAVSSSDYTASHDSVIKNWGGTWNEGS
jgi:hypothetical protein